MPYSYYPAYQPYQLYSTPLVQQPVPNGIVWVSGDAEADAYPIAPNNAVRLWHSTLPIVYFKSADASGKPTLKSYDLVERAQSASAGTSEQVGASASYATKSDLDALSQALDAIKGEVKSVRKELKKRKEVDEDDE